MGVVREDKSRKMAKDERGGGEKEPTYERETSEIRL